MYCEAHHDPNEHRNLVEQECNSCHLLYPLNDKSLCECCDPKSFESGRLAKQNSLMAYLAYMGLHGTSTDKMVDGGECGRERPDRVFELPDRVIIVECDENQHKERACVCEQTRMVNIGQAFGGLPVYFIRWNPDEYACSSELQRVLVRKRQEELGELVTHWTTCALEDLPVTGGLVWCFFMYFDGWEGLHRETWARVV